MPGRKRIAVIASYFEGETYGLLGPQMAATLIQDHTPYECIVVAVTHRDDKGLLKEALSDFFGKERPVVGFSNLSGREDLFLLGKELKEEGALTILAGPQADVDYLGETGWGEHPHRFPGVSENFSVAIHGPGEQALPLLNTLDDGIGLDIRGLLYRSKDGTLITNPGAPWDERHLRKVDWGNLYRVGPNGLQDLKITAAQVLQHIGCPHASRAVEVEVDYPSYFKGREKEKIGLVFAGCSFCDVAVDKGFHGSLDIETVLAQIQCLPEAEDGRKIPFELINENALPGLPRLLKEIEQRGLPVSQINLTLRADWFLLGERHLRDALQMARRMRVRFLLSSMGFESFDDGILRNLNKGLTVETNLRAIDLMRRIKREFPFQWMYSRQEGADHGLIHPTPWDSAETAARFQQALDRYRLSNDVLPQTSIPLIIHHASGLADWIREIEKREKVRFQRYVSAIGWWEEALMGKSGGVRRSRP
ncbi:MAG: hypothetical protein JW821_16145 [Deltaproteobacteria bacterium]|nr:hypothetical protein [Deltaproteobacteria bacterium]